MGDVGARAGRVSPRLAAACARRCARPRHLGCARHADLCRAPVAARDGSRPRGRGGHRGAPSLGTAPGGRHHAPPVPAVRGGRHPGDRREVRQPPRDHRLPGRQRAWPVPAAQPARVRRVPALARRPLRGCRDAQPRVGAHVLVAAHPQLGRALASRWQPLAAVPARVAPLPGRARHRLHRVAGPHRARVRGSPPVRDDLHLVRAPGDRRPASSCRGSMSRRATRTT